MPDRLELTRNVLFFRSDTGFTDNVIREISNLACDNKENNSPFIIDEFRIQQQTKTLIDYTISINVFPTVRPVYFLDDESFEDRIYAYLVLIEIEDYLVVLSKSCSTYLQIIKENFHLIDVNELSKLIGEKADIQK